MKATDGRTYVDPTFGTNKEGATAAGLAVGAYHFARPDTSAGDAVAEADHYVATAELGPGNVIPVLDLEERTSMSASTRIAWALAWLHEVRRKLHVHPMVYSGPNYWQTYMDDTTVIAENGYPLWLAHWTSGTPTVPGGNWAGKGWNVWQWSSTGSVPGISGPVDQDRLNGLLLNRIQIPLLTVTRTASGTLTSMPRGIDCGARCDVVFDPWSDVGVTATPGLDAVLVRWGGACSGSAECTVTMAGDQKVRAVFGYTLTVSVAGPGTGSVSSAPAGVTCPDQCAHAFADGRIVTLSAVPEPGSEFTGWSGDCAGSADCTVSIDQARTVSATFADDTPPTVELDPPTTLVAPTRARFSEAVHGISGENLVERVAGRAARVAGSLRCSNGAGRAVDCSTGNVTQASLWRSGPRVPGQTYVIEANPAGTEPIADGGGNPAADTATSFRAATSVDDSSPAVEPRWRTARSSRAMGGSYTVEHLGSARATYAFDGPAVTWYSVAGPSFGEARVRVDGVSRGRFNHHAATVRFGVAHSFTRLGRGSHRLSITALGHTGGREGETAVAVDGFRVGRAVDASPDVAYRWAGHDAKKAAGGSYSVADLPGASIRLRFRGTAVDLVTVLGPGQGRARVYVDGLERAVVDGYAPTRRFGVTRHFLGLTDSVHVLRIVVLGTKRAASHGTAVAVDAFGVT